jgi:glycosyltransferase involved in cell wall biosynthesis
MPLSDKPEISVIMPAYNHEKYVEEAIMSVLNQEGVDFELIVINDGSTDKTPYIIDRLSKKFDFIYLSQSNKGIVLTIIEGLRIAKGNYISFLASDDFYLRNRLALGVRFMESCGSKINAVYSKALIVNQISEPISVFEKMYPHPLFRLSNRELWIGNWISAASVTYKAAFFAQLKFPVGLKIEDWFILLNASMDCGLAFMDERTTAYRIHTSNSSFNYMNAAVASEQVSCIASATPAFKRYLEYMNLIKRNPLNILSWRFVDLIDLPVRIVLRKCINHYFRSISANWSR